MNMNTYKLRRELTDAGATPAELEELLTLTADLGELSQPKAPKTSWFSWPRLVRGTSVALAGALAGVALIISVESVLPTNPLYALQKASDNVAMKVHPEYRGTVMMKRAQQVNTLVAQHAGSPVVLATLHDYADAARSYKNTPHADYAAFEFCKSNLQQAAAKATPAEKAAITKSLTYLQNI
jgi:hypothetical protein